MNRGASGLHGENFAIWRYDLPRFDSTMLIAEQDAKPSVIVLEETIVCDYCHDREAAIYQVTGNFCLGCWQAVTHSNV